MEYNSYIRVIKEEPKMARPIKWRKVETMPKYRYFIPVSKEKEGLNENILKVEEIEAIRLRDLESLEQKDCANKMEISRQTFQRIYNEAKRKVADSLINGKAIKVAGGNYTQHICKFVCKSCGNNWQGRVEDLESEKEKCPECGSGKQFCNEKNRGKKCRMGCRNKKNTCMRKG